MSDQYADLITGVVLSQELLVRCLETQGSLVPGAYRAALEEHMKGVSPVRRDHAMYGPIQVLIKALGKPAPVARRKH